MGLALLLPQEIVGAAHHEQQQVVENGEPVAVSHLGLQALVEAEAHERLLAPRHAEPAEVVEAVAGRGRRAEGE